MNKKIIIAALFGLLHIQNIFCSMAPEIRMHANKTTQFAVLYVADKEEKFIFTRIRLDESSDLAHVNGQPLKYFLETTKSKEPFHLQLFPRNTSNKPLPPKKYTISQVTFAPGRDSSFKQLDKLTESQ